MRLKKVMRAVGKVLTITGTILTLILLFGATVLYFSIQWMFDTWSNLSMDELVYHLSTSLDGTSTDMIMEYLGVCVAPAAVLFLTGMFVFWGLRGKKRYYIVMAAGIVVSVTASYSNVKAAWNELDAGNYVKSQGVDSTFVEDYYVSPADVAHTFPEEKRNLIYIFLESMETTFADKENGGAFAENVIPELTRIAQENEDFSGSGMELNGGYSLVGTTWTMGAMFGQTAGIPLSVAIDRNTMDTQETFFSGAVTLGDILQQAGYSQTLMIGSDATFGGRRLYFTEHGNYDIADYIYAAKQEWIPEGYRVWWGYEDQRLFEFAKKRLLEIAEEGDPFNFTMLTVDTHFEDGYVCEICPDTYEGDQYANVMACSSVQLADFLDWIKKQDFYENTTVVICGDHPTMDKDFCADVDSEYERKTYTAYINSSVECKNEQRRTYATFDHLPTTLAAMGVKIEGDRLGLGTNLFSGRPTLTEEIGLEDEQEELRKRSRFLEDMANLDIEEDAMLNEAGKLVTAKVTAGTYHFSTGTMTVEVQDFQNLDKKINSMLLAVWTEEDQSDMQWIQMNRTSQENEHYQAEINASTFGYKEGEYQIHAYVVDEDGEQYFVGKSTGIVE